MKGIILIGDSIRQDYESVVAAELEGQATVWGPHPNSGTSRFILENLNEWVLSRPEEILHVNCGLHDIARDPDEQGVFQPPRVPLTEYKHNVREILSRSMATGKTVIWATITPVNSEHHAADQGFHRRRDEVDAYNAAAVDVAKELNVPVNDLFSAVRGLGEDRVLRPDGVHFTTDGNIELGNVVASFLRSFL